MTISFPCSYESVLIKSPAAGSIIASNYCWESSGSSCEFLPKASFPQAACNQRLSRQAHSSEMWDLFNGQLWAVTLCTHSFSFPLHFTGVRPSLFCFSSTLSPFLHRHSLQIYSFRSNPLTGYTCFLEDPNNILLCCGKGLFFI